MEQCSVCFAQKANLKFVLRVLTREVSAGHDIAHLLPGFSKPRKKGQSLSLKFRYSGFQLLHTVPLEDLAKGIPLGQRSHRGHLHFLEQSTRTPEGRVLSELN